MWAGGFLQYFFVTVSYVCIKRQREAKTCPKITTFFSLLLCHIAASPSRHSISEWRMQSIARDSDDSSDEEFFDAHGNQIFVFSLIQDDKLTLWSVLQEVSCFPFP